MRFLTTRLGSEGESDIREDGKTARREEEVVLEQGVWDEIRVLRAVMSRLMVEEEDLSKLVAGVARLSTAIVQASRLQRSVEGEARDPFDGAMNRARE